MAAPFAARGLWLDLRLARQETPATRRPARPRGGLGRALAWLASPGPLLIYVLALSLGARLWSVRDLVMPNWWDSVHHTVIVQLLLDHGGLFSSWEPYAPLTTFTYHFGFHGAVASLSWLSGLAAPQAVLVFGQVLNGLTVLGAYLLAQRLTGRPWAGLLAALVTGLVSLMPAYYVNWGRYTQLAGQIILPALMVVTMEAVERGGRRRLAVMAILAAGLALTHYRVAIFYGAFVVALLLVRAWQNRRAPRTVWHRGGSPGRGCLAALALTAPWVWNLWLNLAPGQPATSDGRADARERGVAGHLQLHSGPGLHPAALLCCGPPWRAWRWDCGEVHAERRRRPSGVLLLHQRAARATERRAAGPSGAGARPGAAPHGGPASDAAHASPAAGPPLPEPAAGDGVRRRRREARGHGVGADQTLRHQRVR